MSAAATILPAVKASLKVVIMMLCGFVLAKKSVLDPTTSKKLGVLLVNCLIPALLFVKISETFTGDNPISEYAGLFAFAPILVAAGMVLGLVVHVLAGAPAGYRRFTVACVAIGNSRSMPLALIGSLAYSMSSSLASNSSETPAEIESRGITSVLAFNTVSTVLTWTVGYYLLMPTHVACDDRTSPSSPPTSRGAEDESKKIGGRLSAVVIQQESPVLARQAANSLGYDSTRAPRPAETESSLDMEALLKAEDTVSEGDSDEEHVRQPPETRVGCAACFHRAYASLCATKVRVGDVLARAFACLPSPVRSGLARVYESINPPVVAAALGLAYGFIPGAAALITRPSTCTTGDCASPLDFVGATLETLGGAVVPLMTILTGAAVAKGVGRPQKSLAPFGEADPAPGISTKLLVLICVARLAVMPVVGGALALGLRKAGLFGSDPLIVFVAMLQSCTPTAMQLNVIASSVGNKERDVALTQFVQSLAAIVTVTISISIFAMFL